MFVCFMWSLPGNITVTDYTSYKFNGIPRAKHKTAAKVWYPNAKEGSYIPSFIMIG